jgi:hypothetical protein
VLSGRDFGEFVFYFLNCLEELLVKLSVSGDVLAEY